MPLTFDKQPTECPFFYFICMNLLVFFTFLFHLIFALTSSLKRPNKHNTACGNLATGPWTIKDSYPKCSDTQHSSGMDGETGITMGKMLCKVSARHRGFLGAASLKTQQHFCVGYCMSFQHGFQLAWGQPSGT